MQFGNVRGIDKPISRLALGTIMLREDEPEEGFELLDAAVAAGINCFDTGASYAGGSPDRALGQWFEARGNREDVVVIGKGGHRNADRDRVTPFDITADLFDSLARHRSDYIDLYLLHRDNVGVEVGPIVDTLNEHLAANRVRAVGGSNWTSDRIEEANEYADKHGLSPFAASSPNVSLAVRFEEPWRGCLTITGDERAAERDWYKRTRMPLFSWSSLSGGFLSGLIRRDNYQSMQEAMPVAVTAYCREPNFQRLDRATELANEKGVAVAQIAVAWILRQPYEIFALIGPRTTEELRSNVRALEIELTDAEADWLNLERKER